MRGASLLLLSCLVLPVVSSGQDLFDSLRTIQYADHLYRSASFREAIDEYERFNFQFTANDITRLRLVRSYRLAGMPDRALARAYQLWGHPPVASPGVALEYYGLRIQRGAREGLLDSIMAHRHLPHPHRLFLASAYHLLADQHHEAHRILEPDLPQGSPTLLAFRDLALQGMALEHRSPWLSGALSTVLPGAGKIYTGQWQDGLLALVMVGTSAWQSYRGFSRNGWESVYGWVFGALGMGFYVGNIYGSVKSAFRHNTLSRERIRIRAQTIFLDNI